MVFVGKITKASTSRTVTANRHAVKLVAPTYRGVNDVAGRVDVIPISPTQSCEIAERLFAAYVEPDSNRADIISELITLFDGPQQREPQRLAKDALAQSEGRS